MAATSKVYSVLQPSGRYKYYRGLRGVDEWGQSSMAPRVGMTHGVHFEEAIPTLPLGSVEIGEGEQPQGTIVRPGSFAKTAAIAATLILAGYIFWSRGK